MVVPRNPARAIDDQTNVLRGLMSGAATFEALIKATQELTRLAPDDQDIFVLVDDVDVIQVRFIEPHTFSFEGFKEDGQRAWIVQHFSQLNAKVVYHPKRGTSRVITGFSQAV